MTAEPWRVGIVGLGLIGGSIARDLARAGWSVAGHDEDADTLDAACGDGVVHERLDRALAGLEMADVVVIAVPVSATPDVLRAAAPRLSRVRLIMDVGSTKRGVIDAAESADGGIAERFVGAHPMAGDHRAGWAVSRCGLFAGVPVFLCATRSTRADSMREAHGFWTALGGRPIEMNAMDHDALLAYTSHLPHIASSALALAMGEGGNEAIIREAVGPGGRDALRLATASPALWTGIALENADAIGRSLAEYGDQLDRFRAALQRRDKQELRALLAEARDRAQGLR